MNRNAKGLVQKTPAQATCSTTTFQWVTCLVKIPPLLVPSCNMYTYIHHTCDKPFYFSLTLGLSLKVVGYMYVTTLFPDFPVYVKLVKNILKTVKVAEIIGRFWSSPLGFIILAFKLINNIHSVFYSLHLHSFWNLSLFIVAVQALISVVCSWCFDWCKFTCCTNQNGSHKIWQSFLLGTLLFSSFPVALRLKSQFWKIANFFICLRPG